MEEMIEEMTNLSDTSELQNLLMGIAYWVAFIFVMLAIFYIAVKIHNFFKYKRFDKGSDKDEILL